MQAVVDARLAKQRADEFAKSEQLSLGELALKLEAIEDKTKPVVFDFGDAVPTGLDSWRGIYAELSFHYAQAEPKSVAEIIEMLTSANGETFTGYKGGDFMMSRRTPIWVGNWGEASVPGYKGSEEYTTVGVVGVLDGEKVTLVTEAMEC